MASKVEIHLPTAPDQGTTQWIHALTIPSEDIKRFTLRPLKWLRFATFAVCGAKGHLSTTEGNDGIVNYQNTNFDDLADKYFYIPGDKYHLVDFEVVNDRLTSTAITPRKSSFRDEIARRDVRCVFSGLPLCFCDAAHIIPKSKGNDYISFIVDDRASLYDELPPLQAGINSIENGILLRKDLHIMFSTATIGFLKTPNFAMLPADVPQVVEGPIPDKRTTLQLFNPPEGRTDMIAPQHDVDADWSRDSPPSILLDFMYGAAVAKHWKSDSLHAKLEEYFRTDFRPVLAKKNSPPSTPHLDDESGVESDDDDLKDPDWEPSSGGDVRETFTEVASADLLRTMDHMRFLPMLLRGIPPEEMAAEWGRKTKEAERRDQQRSCEKVRQWLDFSPGQSVS